MFENDLVHQLEIVWVDDSESSDNVFVSSHASYEAFHALDNEEPFEASFLFDYVNVLFLELKQVDVAWNTLWDSDYSFFDIFFL